MTWPMRWQSLASSLLIGGLTIGLVLLGSRPAWATYVLFLSLAPALAVTSLALLSSGRGANAPASRSRPALFADWRGWLVAVLLGLSLLQVWRLPTLEARGWVIVAIALGALFVTLAVTSGRAAAGGVPAPGLGDANGHASLGPTQADPELHQPNRYARPRPPHLIARRLALALVVIGALQALYGVVQSAAGFDVLGEAFREPGRIATGTFTNRNHLAGFLNMAQALALGLLYAGFSRRRRHRRSERWAWTWMLLLVGGLMGLSVLLSQSRGGTLTLLVTVLFISGLLVLHRRADKAADRGGLPAAAAWILVLVVLGLGLAVGLESLLERFGSLEGARQQIFADTVELIKDVPLAGVGPGMYRWAFKPYQTVDLTKWYTHAHNDYLEVAAEWGIPLALFLWGFVVWRLYRAARLALEAPRSLTRGLALGSAGAIFSILLHSLADFNLQIPANLMTFAMVLGLAWGLEVGVGRRAARTEPEAETEPETETASTSGRLARVWSSRAWTVPVGGLLLVLLALAAWATFGRLEAERLTLRAESVADLEHAVARFADYPEGHLALARALRDSPMDRDLERAAIHLDLAIAQNPWGWQQRWERARTLELAGRPDEASEAFAAAIERSPRDGRYRWRYANFLVRRGELERAIPEIRAGIAADPRFAFPAWNLLTRLGASNDELDAAWPEDADLRRSFLAFMTRVREPEEVAERLPLALEVWDKVLAAPWFLAEPRYGPRPAPGEPLTAEQAVAEAEQRRYLPVDRGAFFLGWLLRAGENAEARRQWLRLAEVNGLDDAEYREGTNLVWNGGFEAELSRSPLDWVFPRGNGFEAEREAGAGVDGSTALRIDFDGTENLSRVFVYQHVPVAIASPATLSLTYATRSEDLTTDQGIIIDVIERPAGRTAYRGEVISGTTPWQNHEVPLELQPETTRVELRVRRGKSLRIDNKLSGTFWLDNVRLRHQ